MGRKKLAMVLIPTMKGRKLCYNNRIKGLQKKAYQLETLCGIDVLLVCFGLRGAPETWPSDRDNIGRIVHRFWSVPEKVRERRAKKLSDLLQLDASRAEPTPVEPAEPTPVPDDVLGRASLEVLKKLAEELEENINAVEERIEKLKMEMLSTMDKWKGIKISDMFSEGVEKIQKEIMNFNDKGKEVVVSEPLDNYRVLPPVKSLPAITTEAGPSHDNALIFPRNVPTTRDTGSSDYPFMLNYLNGNTGAGQLTSDAPMLPRNVPATRDTDRSDYPFMLDYLNSDTEAGQLSSDAPILLCDVPATCDADHSDYPFMLDYLHSCTEAGPPKYPSNAPPMQPELVPPQANVHNWWIDDCFPTNYFNFMLASTAPQVPFMNGDLSQPRLPFDRQQQHQMGGSGEP